MENTLNFIEKLELQKKKNNLEKELFLEIINNQVQILTED